MIAATSATQTESPGVSTDPATSYLDVGLPSSALTAMQAAPLCVLDMMVTEKQQWVEFGSKAFAVAIWTLSHAACVTLAGRAGCKDSAFSSEDPAEALCLQDWAPYLTAIRETTQTTISANGVLIVAALTWLHLGFLLPCWRLPDRICACELLLS